jgi:acetyl-CoA carboxylase biotin carboxylase subunit
LILRKILIANRGEIAVRVMRACRDMGLATVAVYSECDRAARHVRMADEAIGIGPNPPRESYLRIDRIIDAARASGADAIHPGYGFLSENEDFAAACREAGLTFIGPTAEAITLMGSKTAARRAAIAAGVPVVPGTEEPLAADVPDAVIVERATQIGFPVMVKAVAGGGGKGMRVVGSPADLPSAIRAARSEAGAAFGDSTIYLERRLERPRHIEVQLLADHHGTVLACVERECSIQRRHQKLLEEGPSVAVTEKMRRKLGSTVVDAARAVQYTNAGTFEFLLDDKGNFYFLEVNTRVQVEHPVTEWITGVDIVKEQIRVAAGERLSFKQGDVTFTGHAIECRVNAEDPVTFTPSPGVIHAFSVPGGPGVRVDTFAHSECTIPPYYDSMIAKIIVHGRDRQEAIARMRRTLEMTVIEGIKTSIPLHLKILSDPDFIAGRLSTAFMERYLVEQKKPGDGQLAQAG